MLRFCALSSLCVLLIALTPSTMVAAEANADRFQMNRDIRIQPDDEVGDVTCLNCSVLRNGTSYRRRDHDQRQHCGGTNGNDLRRRHRGTRQCPG